MNELTADVQSELLKSLVATAYTAFAARDPDDVPMNHAVVEALVHGDVYRRLLGGISQEVFKAKILAEVEQLIWEEENPIGRRFGTHRNDP